MLVIFIFFHRIKHFDTAPKNINTIDIVPQNINLIFIVPKHLNIIEIVPKIICCWTLEKTHVFLRAPAKFGSGHQTAESFLVLLY